MIYQSEREFSGKDQFFFSVPISDTEDIAFDHTFAGHRVMKQELVREVETNREPTDVWETLEIEDGELIGKERVEWIDRREEDEAIVNGKVWKAAWQKPLPQEVKEKLMGFATEIYDKKDDLENLNDTFESLDSYMKKIIKDYR